METAPEIPKMLGRKGRENFHRMDQLPEFIDSFTNTAVEASGLEQIAFQLPVEEALVNAIKHGNKEDPNKVATAEWDIADDGCSIRIADQGPGFDPATVPDPLDPENLERPCGRGIMLMRHYTNRTGGNVIIVDPGNTVILTWKYKSPSASSVSLEVTRVTGEITHGVKETIGS